MSLVGAGRRPPEDLVMLVVPGQNHSMPTDSEGEATHPEAWIDELGHE